jgi:hypothetical protein
MPLSLTDKLTVWLPTTGAEAVAVTVTTVAAASLAWLVLTLRLTAGVAMGASMLDTTMLSIPTHSSLPTALVVSTRTCTCAAPLAAAGKVTSTAVTRVARLGPLVASAR